MADTTFDTKHRSDILPDGGRAAAPLQPLDPDIVNDTIPAFFIGRNKEGFWVARDVKGRIGGIFLLENSAMSFAKRASRPTGCALILLSSRFELDLENEGNRLVPFVALLMRLATRGWRQMAAAVGRSGQAVSRRRDDSIR
jgi:hypothetical protein